jgi:hypothetical protein
MPTLAQKLGNSANGVQESAPKVVHETLSKTGQYWVVNTSPPSGSPTVYTVVEGTQAQALSLGGGTAGPYSLAKADQIAANEPANKNQPGPIPGTTVSPGGGINASNPLSGLAAIGDFFGRLSEGNTWIRVGKVAVGGALLMIGLAHMTGAENKVAQIARSVPIVP